MKFKAILILALCVFSSVNTSAGMIYRSGEAIRGEEYNDILKQWIERKFSIWVGVSLNKVRGDKYIERIYFKADTGLGDATVDYIKPLEIQSKLVNAVKKGIKWSKVAKENKADTSKALACFGYDVSCFCGKSGDAQRTGETGMKFFSAREGRQTNIIISLIDQSNEFINTTIYISPQEMEKPLEAANSIDKTIEMAKQKLDKEELFN